ncbi:MAG: hypothetical protein V1875_09575 [Candidatus Altiarchaeota archaeon]
MKKVLVLSAALLVLLAGIAAAQEDSQTEAFGSALGAKVRLLQLEASLERNIGIGDAVVAAIGEANSSADTGGLEAVLAEMAALGDEVGAASDNPGSGDEAARDFVDMKDDARELSKRFREEARSLVNPGELEGVRGRIGNITRQERKELKDELNRTRLEYNAQKLEDALGAIGASNPALVEQVRGGEAGMKEIKDFLKDAECNMTRKERHDAMLALQEQFAKGRVFANAVADKVRYNQLERVQKRMERRLDRADELNLSDGAKNRLQNRTGWVEGRMDDIRERVEVRVGRIGNTTAKRIENVDRLIGKVEDRGEKLSERIEERLEGGNLTGNRTEHLENRLGRVENRTDAIVDRLEDRKDEIEDKGQKLMDKAGNIGGNGNGGGGHDD